MEYNTSEICDLYPDLVDVVEPIFSNFGSIASFGGLVVTLKCHEDLGLIEQTLETDGTGKVLVIDGGGSLRRALIDINLCELAYDNDWEGILCYGSVRDVDAFDDYELGIQAIASIPVAADHQGTGELNIPVNFGGVTFMPGDYVYADNTGVVLSSENLADFEHDDDTDDDFDNNDHHQDQVL